MEKIFREVSSLSPPIVQPQMICVDNAMQAFAQLRYGLRKKKNTAFGVFINSKEY